MPGVRRGFLEGIKEDAVQSETLTLAGEEAGFARDGDGTLYVGWMKGSLALLVVGEGRAEIEVIAKALIEANKSVDFPTS